MKQFHRMILRMLPAPFVAWLIVLIYLLVMQFLIKFLPQLVGKGLPVPVIFELIAYNLGYMLVLAVPMAALIATLMAFGRLAESNAYVVIKGSGVSFPQLVWPVYLVGILLTAGMWYFNTEIHPESNFRASNLWRDIRTAKPGFDLQAGVFYDGIQDYKILVDEISPENPNVLFDVTIFDYTHGARFRTDIHAVRGELETIREGRYLNMILYDGEVHRRRPPGSGSADRYEVLAFDRHVIRISLEDLLFTRSDPRQGRRHDRTMDTTEMKALVDSFEVQVKRDEERLRSILLTVGTGTVSRDEVGGLIRDVTRLGPTPAINTQLPSELRDTATRTTRSVRRRIVTASQSITFARRKADQYRVEIHKKYSIALACLIFMMIGAPLGLYIRKGGLGTAATLAATIFLFHWISLANGEKLADRGFLEPWLGMWLADIVTGVIAIWLTFYVWRDLRAIPEFSFSFGRSSEAKSLESQ